MAQLLDYGPLLVAFGPASFFVMFYVVCRPQIFIVSITAATFFLVSFGMAAILRLCVYTVRDDFVALAFITILTQEGFRYLYLRGYFMFHRRFSVIAHNAILYPLHDLSSAFASGLSWGLADAIMLYGDVMVRATGEATIVSPTCSFVSVPVTSSVASFLLIFQHTCMMIMAFDADRRKNTVRRGLVILANSASILLAGLNMTEDGCIGFIVSEIVLLLVLAFMVNKILHEDGYQSKKFVD
mmetsp:Transcript_27395/g.66617  ORF Transcript_27395/g.66617 Transcript_27395/m.66617 type:complete len:241 (-) Transcript_27395:145-867(-)